MYKIAIKITIFLYIFSGMLYAVDQTVAAELGVEIMTPLDTSKDIADDAHTITQSNDFYDIDNPTNEGTGIGAFAANGTEWGIISDVTSFFESGIEAIIIIIKLMTGTLVFDTLSMIGIDQVWIYMIQAPMGILNAITIIDYIRSRI